MSKISITALTKHISIKSKEKEALIRSIFMEKDNLDRIDELLSHPNIVAVAKYSKEDILELLVKESVKRSEDMLLEVGSDDFFNEDYIITVKYNAKARSCKSRGIPFLLTFNEYKGILKTKRCKYTNLPLNNIPDDNLQLTLDRIDNKLPYIKGNVVAVCNWVNAFKSTVLENDEAFWKDNPEKFLKDMTKMVSIITKNSSK